MEGFDLSTISGIYVGNTQYSEIYYGSNKVWPIYEDYCKLTLDDDSVVYITDGSETLTGQMINPYRSNVVSVEFKGKKYTSIQAQAFLNCSSLTSVDLSPNITSIGDYTFQNCTSLTSIGDLSNIASIGNYTFYNCNGITGNIDIGSSCISLGIECFRGMSGLQTMTFMGTTPPTCGSNVFANSTFTIRVPQSALETYKTADGFSNYASRIVGY